MPENLEKLFNCVSLLLLSPNNVGQERVEGFQIGFKILIFILNIFYTLFSLIFNAFTFLEYKELKLNMGIMLHMIQTIIPTAMSFYLSLDLMRTRKVALSMRVEKRLFKYKSLATSLLMVKFLIRVMILIVVRVAKLWATPFFANVAYTLCTMMPELVSSMSDFIFVFYIEALTSEIRNFNNSLKLSRLELNTIQMVVRKADKLHNIASDIYKIYSQRIIITIFFNFVQLVIALYWIFIRIAFNHLGGADGLITFAYIVQPLLCIFAICQSTQACSNEVTELMICRNFIKQNHYRAREL